MDLILIVLILLLLFGGGFGYRRYGYGGGIGIGGILLDNSHPLPALRPRRDLLMVEVRLGGMTAASNAQMLGDTPGTYRTAGRTGLDRPLSGSVARPAARSLRSLMVDPGGSIAFPRTAAHGASRQLPRVAATVCFLITERALSLSGRNWSSCLEPDLASGWDQSSRTRKRAFVSRFAGLLRLNLVALAASSAEDRAIR
jgi:hypothetical protein